MKKTVKRAFLCLLAIMFCVGQGCDLVKQSDVEITKLTGSGHYYPSIMNEAELAFKVELTSLNSTGVTISDWKIQVKEGNLVVLEFSKNVYSIYHPWIIPDPVTPYVLAGNSTFEFHCMYEEYPSEDIYHGYDPDTIMVTVFIEEDGGHEYQLEQSAAFAFERL